jgi:hypothetical protein
MDSREARMKASILNKPRVVAFQGKHQKNIKRTVLFKTPKVIFNQTKEYKI